MVVTACRSPTRADLTPHARIYVYRLLGFIALMGHVMGTPACIPACMALQSREVYDVCHTHRLLELVGTLSLPRRRTARQGRDVELAPELLQVVFEQTLVVDVEEKRHLHSSACSPRRPFCE